MFIPFMPDVIGTEQRLLYAGLAYLATCAFFCINAMRVRCL